MQGLGWNLKKKKIVESAPMWCPHTENSAEPLEVKALYMWEMVYWRLYCPCDSRSRWLLLFIFFFFRCLVYSILANPPQSAVSMGGTADCTLSHSLFHPLVGHNKACYSTKQINVRCKKVMMWCWTLTPQSYGLLNQPQCTAIPTDCMI